MSGLRNLVDKLKPTFSEGGKLSFLASTFDAFETFLFVPNTTTQKGAHIRDCNDMKRTMIVVVVALLPALLFGMYNTGYQVGMTGWAAFWFGFLQVLPMIVVSYVVGLGIEFAFAQARGHEDPVGGGAERKADGDPDLTHAPREDTAGQTHEQVAAHIAGLRAHGRDQGAHAPAAEVKAFSALLASFTDHHAGENHQTEIQNDRCHDRDLCGCHTVLSPLTLQCLVSYHNANKNEIQNDVQNKFCTSF